MNSPTIFNRPLILRRKTSLKCEDTFVYQLMFDDLLERCAILTRRFERTLVVAPPNARWKAALLATGKFHHITWMWHTELVSDDLQPYMCRVEEQLPFHAAEFECIISIAELAWINAIPALLHHIRQCLQPDGLFLALFSGGNTLTELRQCLIQAESEVLGGMHAHIHPMVDVRSMGSLLQHAGLALPVVDVDTHTIRYSTLTRLFSDIKAHGASNAMMGRPSHIHRAVLARACAIYAEQFTDADGKFRATLDVISASGWAPHASQQKPLKPGSAQVKLRDVLG